MKEKLKRMRAGSKREALIIALDEYLKKKKIEKLVRSYGKIPLGSPKNLMRPDMP